MTSISTGKRNVQSLIMIEKIKYLLQLFHTSITFFPALHEVRYVLEYTKGGARISPHEDEQKGLNVIIYWKCAILSLHLC